MATNSAFTAQFPEAVFRDAIRETMRMGMPESDDHKLRWYWDRSQDYTVEDPGGDPYDWDLSPTTDEPGNPTEDPDEEGLIVDYAFDFNATLSAGQQTPLGPIDPAKLTVTLFDVDYDRIKTADYCKIGNTRYLIRFEAAPYGLFGVTMHDVIIEAEDQAASS